MGCARLLTCSRASVKQACGEVSDMYSFHICFSDYRPSFLHISVQLAWRSLAFSSSICAFEALMSALSTL
jgi:hypothetical protein